MKKFRSKCTQAAALVLVLALVLLCGTGAFAANVTYTDVDGRWCQSLVEDAAANGLDMLTGDKFYPDKAITRELFVHMVNWAYGLTREADDLPFEDVDADNPYYADIAIAYRAKYIEGRSETEFDPQASLTRQEAAIILSRIIPMYGVSATGVIEQFSDYDDISKWALDSMGRMTTAGYFEGYPDGSIQPRGTLTNAEALALLTRIVADVTIVDDDFTIEEGKTYENTVYTGTITVPAGDEVTFSNCVILGDLVSKTTEAKTNWDLINETRVANIEYADEPVVPSPKPTVEPTVKPTVEPTVKPTVEPTPEPSDDWGIWFE